MPLTPMRLLRIPEPLDSPDFIFEPKPDGFRALSHVCGHRCELVSRNGHTFKQWPQLAAEIAHAVRAFSCVPDGEICRLAPDGRTNFKKLLFRRQCPDFYAFDVLNIDGDGLTGLSLRERKCRLLRVMPTVETRLLYLDHIEHRDAICSESRASVILRASLGSGRTGRIERSDAPPTGPRSRIRSTRRCGTGTSCSLIGNGARAARAE